MRWGRIDQDATSTQKPIGPGMRMFLVGGGAVMLLASLYMTTDLILFHIGAQRVEGQRVRIERDDPRYIAVVRYEVSGIAYEIKSGGYRSLNPELDLAGPVPVLYRPESPEKGRIATPIEMWGWPALLAIMGTAFVAVGRSRSHAQAAEEGRRRRSGRK